VILRQVELAALPSHVLPERYRRNLGTVGWEGNSGSYALRWPLSARGAGGGSSRSGTHGVGHLIIVDGDCFKRIT
jgi:hypothetical protein